MVKTAIWEGLELPMDRALELERRLAQRLSRGAINQAACRAQEKGVSFPPPKAAAESEFEMEL